MQPNIILCMCDQLRAFEVGAYGNAVVRTPNIDRLTRDGVRFETAVATYPICMAARSVLLSGQYNRTCTGGVSNVAFRSSDSRFTMPEYPFAGRPHLKDSTLPEILRSAGYFTGAIGKWHIHSWPHDVGFDDYVIPRVHHCHSGQHYTENGGPEFTPPGYSVDFESRRVERFLEQRRHQGRPFFLYYNISPPHCPLMDAPEKYTRMFDPADVPLRPNVTADRDLDCQADHFKVYRWDFRYYDFHLPYTETLPGGCGIRDIIALYYGLTAWTDQAVGRMLRAVARHGLADDTIVVFTSDHGDNLGSHGLVQKGQPTEESARIPLIARWPQRIPSGSVITDQVAGTVDIAPTLLGLAGLPIPGHMHGSDLSAGTLGKPRAPKDHAFIETAVGVALRTRSYMCSVPFEPATRELADHADHLYDMTADPYQMRNLAGDDGLRTVEANLCRLVREWDSATPWV